MTKKEEEIAAALQWYDGGSPLQMELAKEYYAAMLKGEKAIKELADSYNNTAKAGGILQLEVIQLMIELETLMKLQNKTKSTTVPQSYTTPLKTLYSAYKKYASDIYPDTYAAFLEAPIIAFCTVLIDNGIDELIKETSDTWGRLQEIRQLTEAAATIRRGMESPGGFAVLSVIKDTRALQGINTKRQGKENGSAWEVKLKGGSGTFTLENYKELKRSFTAFTNKVFALTNIYYTQQNKITPTGTIKNIVEIPLEEIAKHLNRGTSPKSIKRLQEDLLDELATIRASSIRGKGYVTGYVRKAETKGGFLRVLYEDEFAAALAHTSVFSRLPWWIFGAESKHAYPLGEALAMYYFSSSNRERKSKTRNSINDIISIENCIKYAEFYSRDYVSKELNRKYKERIKEPLIKALDELTELAAGRFVWEYVKQPKKGAAWQEIKREDAEALNFTEWHALSIRFAFLGADGAPQLPAETE